LADWYKFHTFDQRLDAIEKFFIDIAANEELLLVSGFNVALNFESASDAMAALENFHEDFTAAWAAAEIVDSRVAEEMARLRAEERLLDQVQLVFLRLRMAAARRPVSSSLSLAKSIAHLFGRWLPFRIELDKSSPLTDEKISLQKTIINLASLRTVVRTLWDGLRRREQLDNDVLKPSNVNTTYVLQLINIAVLRSMNWLRSDLTQ